MGAAAIREEQRRLLPVRTVHSRVDHRPGVHLGQPGRPGSDRHGRVGRQVRDDDQPLLLGRRHPGDGLRRHLHDAVLLRLASAIRAGVPEAPLRREDPRLQRDHVRRDDGLLLRHLDVRPGQAAGADARLELPCEHPAVGRHRAGLHLPGRPDLGDLQRSAAVLPHRAGIPAAGAARAQGRGRLERAHRASSRRSRPTRDTTPAPGRAPGAISMRASCQSHGRRVVRHGDGPGVRALVRLLVHGLPGRAAGHGRRTR